MSTTTIALFTVGSGLAGYGLGRAHQWLHTARHLMGTTKKKGFRR